MLRWVLPAAVFPVADHHIDLYATVTLLHSVSLCLLLSCILPSSPYSQGGLTAGTLSIADVVPIANEINLGEGPVSGGFGPTIASGPIFPSLHPSCFRTTYPHTQQHPAFLAEWRRKCGTESEGHMRRGGGVSNEDCPCARRQHRDQRVPNLFGF